MIRSRKDADNKQILNIWEQSSSLAHPFLTNAFVEKVKQDMTDIYIPNTTTWVFEENETVIGFISMLNNEIGGLFVLPNQQSRGIGHQLVDHVKKMNDHLEVEVFEQNNIGRSFYKKYGFELINQYFHEASEQQMLRLKIK